MVCLLVCSVEIMNTLQHIQVLSTCKCVEKGKKRGMHKKNYQNCKFENGSADVHDIIKSFTKSHTVLQHVIIYKCMQKYSHIYFGNLVILS